MAFKVFVNRPDIPPAALALLQPLCTVHVWQEQGHVPRHVLLEKVRGMDALWLSAGTRIDGELLDAAGPQLKVVGTMSAGYDHVDVSAARARHVALGHTPGVLDDAVAELTVALLLCRSRRLWEGHEAARGGAWPAWADWHWLNGMGLKEAAVGVVGCGRIGTEVIRRLVPFKVKEFLYTARSVKPEAEFLGALKVELPELLKRSDFVILTTALAPETTNLVGAKELALMKPTAILVNTSRGGVVDQSALIDALKRNAIGGAALDVMTPEPLPPGHELYTLPNCFVIPHMGSAVVRTRDAMAELTARNLLAGLQSLPLPAAIQEPMP